MRAYLNVVQRILDEGVKKGNRTGIDSIAIAGHCFEHDMQEGFPLLTTRKMYFNGVKAELEFFIKGLTDKKWLQERNTHIWDAWCSPDKVPYGNDEETKRKMREERDLGPVYGFQWRHFGANYEGFEKDYSGRGVDQLENLVKTLKKDPMDRRMIVSAWNPVDRPKMALPPCHYSFQVTVLDDKVNLMWNQRSVDTMVGLAFNIASYGLLLHLLAKESGLGEGRLIGFLGDVHIYENHVENAKLQLTREPYALPKVETEGFSSVFDWQYTQTKLKEYESHPKLDFEIAV